MRLRLKKTRRKLQIRKEVKLYLKFLSGMLFLDTIITEITLNNKMLTRCKVKTIILFQDWNNARATYYFHKSRGEKNAV